MRKSRPLAVLFAALAFLVLVAGSDAVVGVAHALPDYPTISPNPVTVSPGANQTFKLSARAPCCIANWTFVTNASGATLHGAGPFRALYTAGTIQGVTDIIQVTLPNGDRASASVTVSTIVVSPPRAALPPRGTQVFTASGGSGPSYTWDLVVNNSGGSLSADGVYQAGSTGGVIDTIRVTDSAGHSAQLSTTVTSAVTLTPPSATLLPLGTQTFSASGGSGTGYAWALSTDGSGGSVSQDGAYSAGPANSTHDVVTVTDSLGNTASAAVTVGSAVPLTLSPSDVTLPVRTQVAFRPGGGSPPYSFAAVTNASGGHIFRASFICRYACWVTGGTAGVTDVISVTDILGATARATVRVGGLAISPPDVTLVVEATRTFVASGGSDAGYSWTLATNSSEGSIDPVTGRYAAGTNAPSTDVIQVTDSDGVSATAQAHVILPPMLVASPSSSTHPPRDHVDFTASGGSGAGYSWAFVDNASGGTLSAAGAYTAGATGDVTDVIRLTDSLGDSVEATVKLTAALRLSPEKWSLAPRESRTFTVSGGSGSGNTWILSTNRSGGTLTEGLYTAGATGGVTDVVRVTDSLGAFAEATIKVTTPPPPPGEGCGTTGGAALPALVLLLLPILATRRHRSISTTPSNQGVHFVDSSVAACNGSIACEPEAPRLQLPVPDVVSSSRQAPVRSSSLTRRSRLVGVTPPAPTPARRGSPCNQTVDSSSQVNTMNVDGSVLQVSHDDIFHDAPAWGTHP